MADYLIQRGNFTTNMNILIYGEPGSGKTYLAGTAQDSPYMKDVWVMNIDGGMMTLAQRGDIHAVDIRSIDELEVELHKLVNKDPKYKGAKTIVIDNITELQSLSLEGIVQTQLKDRMKKDKGATIDDIYLEDYGKSSTQLARVLRGFRDLPMHVIYIAHKKDKMRKGTNMLESSRPSLTDKLCTAVMGYMDFVWYLYPVDEQIETSEGEFTTETHRYLLTQPYNNYSAKTRGMEFAEQIGVTVRDPDLSQIMAIYAKEDVKNGEN